MQTNNKLPNHVYFLLIGQSINLTTAVLSVTVAALVGLSLAPSVGYATIPYGLQFLAILLSTVLFSKLMEKFGRYRIFKAGILFLFLSGVIGFLSLTHKNFLYLCISHFLLGLFISTANFYRFAATDTLDSELIPKATSMVISGGVFAAIVAPLLAINLAKKTDLPDYSLIYLSLSALAILLLITIYLWNRSNNYHNKNTQKAKMVVLKTMTIRKYTLIIAILGGALGYYIMNLMMIASSIFLKQSHSFNYASYAIQMHVLAMFLPSFFVAKLIHYINSVNTIILGFVLISLSCLLPVLFVDTIFINMALIVLGVGWNFTYSGGSALLSNIQGAQRLKFQGINETVIALFATLGAFLPAPILNYLGWINTNLVFFIFSMAISALFILFVFVFKRSAVSH
ncbi:MFS transporter [Psychrobacter jeotgali]|uniref:MFS transporter n=1 Tax=Psychrobacter jeotgali TaxID=179010 RepID=UPI001917B883|nr:MFS transporter [Psychrobacter jeotgali]